MKSFCKRAAGLIDSCDSSVPGPFCVCEGAPVGLNPRVTPVSLYSCCLLLSPLHPHTHTHTHRHTHRHIDSKSHHVAAVDCFLPVSGAAETYLHRQSVTRLFWPRGMWSMEI